MQMASQIVFIYTGIPAYTVRSHSGRGQAGLKLPSPRASMPPSCPLTWRAGWMSEDRGHDEQGSKHGQQKQQADREAGPAA